MTQRAQPPLLLTVAIYTLAFLVPAWPWLSGAVTVPYDAKSTFLPPVEFMARAFATGESSLWTPNVFAGWPNVADPQSMLTSPLHVLLALVSAAPGFVANDGVSFAYLFLGGLGIILYFLNPSYMGEMFRWDIWLCIPVFAVIMMLLGFLIMFFEH